MRTDIVIIDDNEDHLQATTHLFKARGLNSIAISNPERALEILGSIQPKLIILDIMMPGIDGFSLLKKLKSDARLSRIPTVVLSGKVFPPDRRRAIQLGAEKFIPKPINSGKLIEEISPYL